MRACPSWERHALEEGLFPLEVEAQGRDSAKEVADELGFGEEVICSFLARVGVPASSETPIIKESGTYIVIVILEHA